MFYLKIAQLFKRPRSRKRSGPKQVTTWAPALECLEDRRMLTSILGTAGSFAVLGASTVTNTGPTTLTSSDGYKITTSEARADLEAGLVTGQHPVTAEGAFGSLSANGFEADRAARTVKFKGRVEIHFQPGAEQK